MREEAIIVRHPQIMGGAPCFRGTRIPVEIIFNHLRGGMGPQDIIREWPGVSPGDLKAVLDQARDYLMQTAPEIAA
jgi:uncharacterized protein (DUF433 family)